jgi:Mrp family chromosome partitioning ATPase
VKQKKPLPQGKAKRRRKPRPEVPAAPSTEVPAAPRTEVPAAPRTQVPADDAPTSLGSLTRRERTWLWKGYVPKGVVTVVTGPQGAGKTSFLAALAREATADCELSGTGEGDESQVLWFSTEDDPRSMLLPRLAASGAETKSVLVPDYDGVGKQVRRTMIPTDSAKVAALANIVGASLIVFDPLTSFLAPGFSPNDSIQVRSVMDSLSLAAAEYDVACVVTLHPRKGKSGSPLDWVSGSAAWTQAARQVLLLDSHPDLPGQFLLSVVKRCSSAVCPSWRYRLAHSSGYPVFQLVEETDIDPRELSEQGDLGESLERSEALAWLKEQLVEEREQGELYRRWQQQGYGARLWWRARRKLGVVVTRKGTQREQLTFLQLAVAPTIAP